MKMMKRLLALLCMVVMLSGCMSMNIGFVVKSDKELDMNMEILMSPLLTSEMESGDLKAQFEEGLYANGDPAVDVEVKEITKEVDGATWEGLNVEMIIPEELISTYVSSEDNKLTFTLPMEQADALLEQEGLSLDDMDQETIDMYKQYGVAMTMTVTMPSKPTTNIGIVTNNTVTVDLLSEDLKTLYSEGLVITSSNGGFDASWIIAIVVAVVAIIIVVMMMKKKKAPQNVEQNVSEVVSETQIASEEVVETQTTTNEVENNEESI